ncbi:MAG: AHH domain-containing protein [Planctomycetes bacterium]|nr:AHH domain-containing protein [Planctomycetota bacterium]
MPTKDDHLEELHGLTHKAADKAKVGCLTRHEGTYKSGAWPDCNYRKNAHLYSLANERDVYDVPSLRSPRRWLEFALDYLEPVRFADSSPKAGQVRKPQPLSPLTADHCWDLTHTIADNAFNPKSAANFHDDSIPYFHNTHHIFACDEIYRAFSTKELRILVLCKYNINRDPNAMILPKQRCVAWALKLPAHCPDKANHDDYSERIRTKLSNVKSEFQQQAEDDGHEITEQNAPDLVTTLENDSKELRQHLIAKGNTNPGIDLDLVNIP